VWTQISTPEKIIVTGVIEDSWFSGNMKSIYKNKGCKTDPPNFRPIALINVSCLGNLFNSVLNETL